MKSVFEVTIEQDVSADNEYRPEREVLVVGAVNALIATRKALREAQRNGFMKSRPLEVVNVARIVRNFS